MKVEHVCLLLAAAIAFNASAARAQGGVLIYCRQPTSEPPYKQIHRMNADGTADAALTTYPFGLNYPDWSPDTSKIAVGVYVSGTVWSIYTMNANGSGLTRLTNTAQALDAEPDWSPDGSRIVFSRRDAWNFENEQLWLVNADGSGLVMLDIPGSAPAWSPDGARLIYHSKRGATYGVYVCDADGANEVALVDSDSDEMYPCWSPDGAKIAFVSARDGNPEIYVMDADGSNQARLTNNTARDYTPAWSPDGSLIAYVSDEPGYWRWEIYLMRADGSNKRRITFMPSTMTAINPDWRPQDLRYLGRPRPGLIPERFAPDSLCANEDWFWHGSPIFSPDLKEMHWAKYAIYPAHQTTELMYMKLDENRWSSPGRPDFADSSYMENNPFFPASNDTLLFYSDRPGGPRFRVTRTPTGWSAPTPVIVPPVDGTQSGLQFSLAKNGTMYFELWSGPQCDIYRSRLVGGAYQTPEALTMLNTAGYEFCPLVDPDERFILFDSNRPGGFGLNDIYISIRDEEGLWGEPINLGPTINSSAEDALPSISPDGLYFFYITERPGDAGYNPYWLDAQFIYDMLPDTTTATLLQRLNASYRNGCIEITWTLSEIDEGIEFEILRAKAPGGEFAATPAILERSGLTFTFRDVDIEPGAAYRYRVQYDDSGKARVLFETDAIAATAMKLALLQNTPNPFNPSTVIGYDLPARSYVTLSIYDITGRLVRALVRGEMDGGAHRAVWDGLDPQGRPASSGVYFYRLTAGKESISRKLVLLR